MARTPKKTISFLKPVEQKEYKSISVRVPVDLYNSFENVKYVASKFGYTVSLTDVVLQAMHEACTNIKEDLNEKQGRDVFQTDMDLQS